MCAALVSPSHALPSCHLTASCEVGDHYEAKRGCTANIGWGQYLNSGSLTLEPLL